MRNFDPRHRVADPVHLWKGVTKQRLVRNGLFETTFPTQVVACIEDGHVHVDLLIYKDLEKAATERIMCVTDAVDPLVVSSVFRLAESSAEIDCNLSGLFEQVAEDVLYPDEIRDEVDSKHAYAVLAEKMGRDVLDTALKAPEKIADVVTALTDAGIPVSFDSISSAFAKGLFESELQWLVEHGAESPKARRKRLEEEHMFLAPLLSIFEEMLRKHDGGVKNLKPRLQTLRAIALEYGKYNIPEQEFLVGLVYAVFILQSAGKSPVDDLFNLSPIRELTFIELAARFTADVLPNRRPEKEIRWAIMGLMTDIAMGTLRPENDRKRK